MGRFDCHGSNQKKLLGFKPRISNLKTAIFWFTLTTNSILDMVTLWIHGEIWLPWLEHGVFWNQVERHLLVFQWDLERTRYYLMAIKTMVLWCYLIFLPIGSKYIQSWTIRNSIPHVPGAIKNCSLSKSDPNKYIFNATFLVKQNFSFLETVKKSEGSLKTWQHVNKLNTVK